MSLMRYLEMLKSAEFRDDLDVVSTIHTPKGQRPFCNKLARFVKIILHQLEVYDSNSSGITSLPYFELSNHALGMALSSYQVAALTVTAHETGVLYNGLPKKRNSRNPQNASTVTKSTV